MHNCGIEHAGVHVIIGWDDLRIFVAAARAGSFGEASNRLGVDPATVSRRVARLESVLKATLLTRSKSGLQLTAAGDQLLRLGLEAETVMAAAAKVGRPDVVGGTVRVSTAEGFGVSILAPALPAFVERRRGIKIELAATSGFLSPSRREVDMAVTLSAPDSPRIAIETLTTYQLALYASPGYLDRRGEPGSVVDLRACDIVGYVDDLIYAPELRYLDEILPALTPTLACTSIHAQRAIIAAGGGIGVMPCFMADGLVRVLADDVLLERRFWLSTHRDVYDTARIRAVRTWLGDLVQAQKPRLNPF